MADNTALAGVPLRLVFAEGTGSFLVLLAIAQQQRFFEKYAIEIQPAPARGATVPRLTSAIPIGMIGEPAAILQAAEGVDLRVVASLSSTPLSGHLVARPEFMCPGDLRGKRIGVRVVGAGIWISTILALEQLGLSPQLDGIRTVPTGSPAEIVRALEEGAIDAALVTVAQSRALKAKGYSVLLEDYPDGIMAYGGCLAVSAEYLAAHPQEVQSLIAALTEALAFALAKRNFESVLRAFGTSLSITDPDTVLSNLRELKPKPYPLLAALEKMQTIMATHDPRVGHLDIKELVDDRFVRELDKTGLIARLQQEYGCGEPPAAWIFRAGEVEAGENGNADFKHRDGA
jgi:ABC-type nitrate/sulfonate/bicarbonate transport system substrate-binding protein